MNKTRTLKNEIIIKKMIDGKKYTGLQLLKILKKQEKCIKHIHINEIGDNAQIQNGLHNVCYVM